MGIIEMVQTPPLFPRRKKSYMTNFQNNTLAAVGQSAPNFELRNENGAAWRLADQIGKVTVLLFYPQNETLVCTKQLCSVRDNWSKYLETKAVIVGVSPGDAQANQRFSEHHRLPLPLLADEGRVITSIYGKHPIFPISFTRAVVVVDAKGVVRSREVMLRAFRPKDADVISSIYAARTDALNAKYEELKTRIHDSFID